MDQPLPVHSSKTDKSLSHPSTQSDPDSQTNRLLIHKPIRIRLVIAHRVVMQPRLTVCILVLQSEGLVCAIRYLGFLFQTTLMLTSDEVVKEQTFQMTSKKNYSKSIIGNSRISFVVSSPIFFSIKDNFLFFTNLSSWNAYS